jgi:hypothetical protein
VRVGYKVWLDNDGKAFGDGPYELLKRVDETHSLHRAAKEMGMAYSKAWRLIGAMEKMLDSLKQNIFEGEILDIAGKERYQTVYFQTTSGNILFEISIPNYAFRNLNLSVGKIVSVALRDESLWVMS